MDLATVRDMLRFLEVNTILLPLISAVVVFVVSLLIALATANDGFKSIVGIGFALVFWTLALSFEDQPVTRDTFFALGGEIFGNLCIFGVLAVLKFCAFDWRSADNTENTIGIVLSSLIVALLMGLSLMLFTYQPPADVSSEMQRIGTGAAATLSVEVYASSLMNAALLLPLAVLVFRNLLRTQDINNLAVLLLFTWIFAAVSILVIARLPETVYTATFPRQLSITMLGAIFSATVASIWEFVGQKFLSFLLFGVLLLIVSVVLFFSAPEDDLLLLSVGTELFGILIVTTLTSNHLLRRLNPDL